MAARRFANILHLATFGVLTSAQSLAFLRPSFDRLDHSAIGLPEITAGQNLTIEWQSDFDLTSLLVYQSVADGSVFRTDVIAGKL